LRPNGELHNTPEKINTDPHNAAWLIKVRLANPAEVKSLDGCRRLRKFIAEKSKDASA